MRYTTTIGQSTQPITIPAGSYSTTDQSNYSLCSVYKDEGCAQEFADAQNHNFTAIRYSYNLSNEVTVNSTCMHNNSNSFEALADFSQELPNACTDSSSCGYSQTYGAQLITIPSIAITSYKIGASSIAGYNCLLDGSLNQNLRCWGNNSNGNLGNGIIPAELPAPVSLPTGVTAFQDLVTAKVALSSNSQLSCATAASGEHSGQLYCWGENSLGQLGNGSTTNSDRPTAVTMPSGVTSFISVAISNGFNCAIGNDKNAYCWGFGRDGKLGNNTTVSSSLYVPTKVSMPDAQFTLVSSNNNFSCALTTTGEAYCWGLNSYGQIGNDTLGAIGIPTPVTMPNGVSFASIATNEDYSCALSKTGQAYCWGNGTKGQIGNGNGLSTTLPTAVTMPANVSSFNQVVTNENFNCAIANTGTIYCWGDNANGQIGNKSTAIAKVPTPVEMPNDVTSFSALSSNNNFSCAIANNGKIYCWGYNLFGQIGNGNSGAAANVNVPTAVNMPEGVNRFISVATSLLFSCALTDAGKAYCWGNGVSGQIGNGGTLNVNLPTLVN